MKSGTDLLLFLESRLLGDSKTAGVEGRVAVGVRGEPTLWCNANFQGSTVEHEIAPGRTGDPDVEVVLSDGEAVALLEGKANIDPYCVVGDRALLKKFLNRYVNVQSSFDLRLKKR